MRPSTRIGVDDQATVPESRIRRDRSDVSGSSPRRTHTVRVSREPASSLAESTVVSMR